MKYLLAILALLPNLSDAQIGTPQKATPSIIIGKIAPLGSFTAELSYQVAETDTTYTLRFRNAKYTQITSTESVLFDSDGNAVDGLYKAFKSVFTEENRNNKDYLIHFTIGKDVVAISTYKNMGITQAMFLVKDAHFSITEKQVDKLFGKN
jgi:hypothetical protein